MPTSPERIQLCPIIFPRQRRSEMRIPLLPPSGKDCSRCANNSLPAPSHLPSPTRKTKILKHFLVPWFGTTQAISQPTKPTSFLVPGTRKQGASEHRDWRSQARPIHSNLLFVQAAFCPNCFRREYLVRDA